LRIVNYLTAKGPSLGLVRDARVAPLAAWADLFELIDAWDDARITELARNAEATLPLGDLQLLAPLTPRRNLLCIGWNYRAHFEEGKGMRGAKGPEAPPEHPTLFTKASGAAAGPTDDIPLHEGVTAKLDWEAELAVVIGRRGVDIAEADALDHVFGYMAANDVSARDLQHRHGGQWFKGKSLDRCCPLGPWVVTRDEIPDPQTLDVTCRVNGVVKQSANTQQQMFGVARLISILSQGMTLMPGDVILTGTPEGVGNSRTPPEYLAHGDVMETEIAGIGVLRNRIVRQGGDAGL
jgi:2-keto-4-pentenoate hydratase/2-oxohepta-3-ene-1,7-dioic acid hydratase in catechol pathway